jgi:hypothetical protein
MIGQKSLSALMAQLSGRFLKQQTIVSLQQVDSSATVFQSDRMQVQLWLFAAERQTESAFSRLIAVASPLIASGLRQ